MSAPRKVRFTVNDRGELEDRDGNVLGRLTSLTLELRGQGGTIGGVGVLPLQLPGVVEAKPLQEMEGGSGETTDPQIDEVWTYWLEKRDPRRRELEKAQAKLLAKALKVADVDELKLAIDGLLSSDWHRENGRQHLSSILATRPGGPTLRDQIDSFIERSGSSTPSPAAAHGRSQHTQGLIRHHVGVVQRLWDRREELDPEDDRRRQLEESLAFLERNGVTASQGRFTVKFEGIS